MAYRPNPFLERLSAHNASDQEFASLFSPNVLDKIPEGAFLPGVHVFRSSPGAGKSTLLRVLTPSVLRAIWQARRQDSISESFEKLEGLSIVSEKDGPIALGVLLSCAAGYADLPSGLADQGLFRALFDCRVVLRALRSVAPLIGAGTDDAVLERVTLDYAPDVDLGHIPKLTVASELLHWAVALEQRVYDALNVFAGGARHELPAHLRFGAIEWLQRVRLRFDGVEIAPRRILLVDDLQYLRASQRDFVLDELVVTRPSFPIWLAERTVASSNELVSQGARPGRDAQVYVIEDLWGAGGARQFVNFAQNVLDRRMQSRGGLPVRSFAQCLRSDIGAGELDKEIRRGLEMTTAALARYSSDKKYDAWLDEVRTLAERGTIDSLREIRAIRILVARIEGRKQMELGLSLPLDDIEERDTSAVRGAAEIFLREEVHLPYYFGLERLCAMASSNVEELLFLAAALYAGLQGRRALTRGDISLAPAEQERLLQDAARKKLAFVSSSHTEGSRARRLLESIGSYCRERTMLPNAPYCPGVTGIRISASQAAIIQSNSGLWGTLERVIRECVAENLLIRRASSASGNREAGTVYYLNQTLCACFGLPLALSQWQDVRAATLNEWMERGRTNSGRLPDIE